MGKPRKKQQKEPEQTYRDIKNAINITLYDTTGTALDPRAQEEFEEAALHVAQHYPNVLLSIATT